MSTQIERIAGLHLDVLSNLPTRRRNNLDVAEGQRLVALLGTGVVLRRQRENLIGEQKSLADRGEKDAGLVQQILNGSKSLQIGAQLGYQRLVRSNNVVAREIHDIFISEQAKYVESLKLKTS